MKDPKDSFRRLEQYSGALLETIRDILPQVRDALDGKVELPENSPSRQSLGAHIFRQIEKWFLEVEAAMNDVRDTIWE